MFRFDNAELPTVASRPKLAPAFRFFDSNGEGMASLVTIGESRAREDLLPLPEPYSNGWALAIPLSGNILSAVSSDLRCISTVDIDGFWVSGNVIYIFASSLMNIEFDVTLTREIPHSPGFTWTFEESDLVLTQINVDGTLFVPSATPVAGEFSQVGSTVTIVGDASRNISELNSEMRTSGTLSVSSIQLSAGPRTLFFDLRGFSIDDPLRVTWASKTHTRAVNPVAIQEGEFLYDFYSSRLLLVGNKFMIAEAPAGRFGLGSLFGISVERAT